MSLQSQVVLDSDSALHFLTAIPGLNLPEPQLSRGFGKHCHQDKASKYLCYLVHSELLCTE